MRRRIKEKNIGIVVPGGVGGRMRDIFVLNMKGSKSMNQDEIFSFKNHK